MILADRKLKLREIAKELKISDGSVFTFLREYLSMRKLCSKWVPRLLTVNHKQQIDDSKCYLELFNRNKQDLKTNTLIFSFHKLKIKLKLLLLVAQYQPHCLVVG